MSPRFAPEARTANMAALELLKRIAEKRSDTGTDCTRMTRRAEALDCAHFWYNKTSPSEGEFSRGREELTADLRDIEHATSTIRIQGARLPEAVLKISGL